LPTVLPQPRRAAKKPSPARTVFDFLFNATLVVSALILTVIVLVREEQYALGRPASPAQTIERTAHDDALDTTGETAVLPPAD
jgi:hypothetical protein